MEGLNASDRSARLDALRDKAVALKKTGAAVSLTEEVNNHVHTCYSFSPYSPAAAAWTALNQGLGAVGCMDHDSVSGATEMSEAGAILGMGTTSGCELRVNMAGTPMEGRKINNPDSKTIIYMAIHGIPAGRIAETRMFIEPINRRRNARNREIIANINARFASLGLSLDFDKDVWSISRADEGGSITERHILFALARKIVAEHKKGEGTLTFLTQDLGLSIPAKLQKYLADTANPHYLYDLLGVFKGGLLSEVYVQPDFEEALPVAQAVDFANRIGAIPAYAYLGDVEDSPTGDKKAEKFEDAYLDELMEVLKAIGFKAVTYMPPRNTRAQLKRIIDLCARYDLMEISGVDINSSRQSFRCPEVMLPEFRHLIDSTWALIAHEKLGSLDESLTFFHPKNPLAGKTIQERITAYAAIGGRIDYTRPEKALEFASF